MIFFSIYKKLLPKLLSWVYNQTYHVSGLIRYWRYKKNFEMIKMPPSMRSLFEELNLSLTDDDYELFGEETVADLRKTTSAQYI